MSCEPAAQISASQSPMHRSRTCRGSTVCSLCKIDIAVAMHPCHEQLLLAPSAQSQVGHINQMLKQQKHDQHWPDAWQSVGKSQAEAPSTSRTYFAPSSHSLKNRNCSRGHTATRSCGRYRTAVDSASSTKTRRERIEKPKGAMPRCKHPLRKCQISTGITPQHRRLVSIPAHPALWKCDGREVPEVSCSIAIVQAAMCQTDTQ